MNKKQLAGEIISVCNEYHIFEKYKTINPYEATRNIEKSLKHIDFVETLIVEVEKRTRNKKVNIDKLKKIHWELEKIRFHLNYQDVQGNVKC